MPKIHKKITKDYIKLARKRGFQWLGIEAPANTTTKTTWKCPYGHTWPATFSKIRIGRGCPYCSYHIPKTDADYVALAAARSIKWLGKTAPSRNTTSTQWECARGHLWNTSYKSIEKGFGCHYCTGSYTRTADDYHALAKQRHMKWLGRSIPKSLAIRTRWECSQGHPWSNSYNMIKAGVECPLCSGRVPKTRADYRSLAEHAGIKWIGVFPSTVHGKTEWQCRLKHRWKTSYSLIQHGTRCPFCAGVAPKVEADYHALAKKWGFQWIGPMPKATHSKTSWKCINGHKFRAPYSYIGSGGGCARCSGKARKREVDYRSLAKSRGYKWLGPMVVNVQQKTNWKCNRDHQWEMSYAVLSNRKAGCPFCAKNAKVRLEDYTKLASGRHLSWEGNALPAGANIPTFWKCEYDHIWRASYTSIKGGSRCPYCVKNAPKVESDYHKVGLRRNIRWLGKSLPATGGSKTQWQCKVGHIWLASYTSIATGHGCHICSAKHPTVEDYVSAGAYRGYKFISKNLPNNIRTLVKWECKWGHRFSAPYRDIRGRACPRCPKKGAGVRKTSTDYYDLAAKRGILWIGELEPDNTTRKTMWECQEGHLFKTSYAIIRAGHLCPHCARNAPKVRNEYIRLGIRSNITWIGEFTPHNSNTKTKWKCRLGHEWNAPYSQIRNGSGCPYCARRVKITVKDYRSMARNNHIKWIGKILPANIKHPTEWECRNHHRWSRSYSSMKKGGSCSKCAGTIKKSMEDYRNIATSRGWKWLGHALPKNNKSLTTWQCPNGHKIQRSYNHMDKGYGCMICKKDETMQRLEMRRSLIADHKPLAKRLPTRP